VNSARELQVATRSLLNLAQVFPDPVPLSETRIASVADTLNNKIDSLKSAAARIAKIKGAPADKQRTAISREIKKYTAAKNLLNILRLFIVAFRSAERVQERYFAQRKATLIFSMMLNQDQNWRNSVENEGKIHVRLYNGSGQCYSGYTAHEVAGSSALDRRFLASGVVAN
jgi:hypothetical protein